MPPIGGYKRGQTTSTRVSPIPNPQTIPVAEEAESCFRKLKSFKECARKNRDDIETALWGRAILQARQFALIYAASADPENPVVDENAAQWATEIVAYLIKQKITLAKLHIADNPFDKLQKEAIRFLKERGGQCTRNEFTRRFHRIERRKREEVIDNLKDTGVIKIVFQTRGTKKTELFVLQKAYF